jgi:hypothetical protein
MKCMWATRLGIAFASGALLVVGGVLSFEAYGSSGEPGSGDVAGTVRWCLSPRSIPCPAKAQRVVVTLEGAANGKRPVISVPVRLQGRKRDKLAFESGSRVAVASGCLACHRIGQLGSRGPGLPLTHIASRLSERELERKIVTGGGVMPSFRRLPKADLESLLRFLTLLR